MTKSYPKVSVMIPTYNQEQYIAEAIESVLMQDYENIEIVISDDCSTDSTPEIIKKYLYDKRVKYVRNEPNLGRVGNYHNTLYNHTTGDWIINLDGDDYYTDKHFISRAMENIQKAQQYSNNIIAYIYKHLNIDKIKNEYIYSPISDDCIIISGSTYFLNYYKIGGFGHMNTLYRKDKAIEIGDCYTKPYQASDFHSLIRLFMLGDILLDKNIIGHWRVHENNTTIIEIDNKYIDSMKTFDDIEDFAKNKVSDKELRIWRKNVNKVAFYDYARTYILNRRNLKSIILLFKVFELKYSYLKLWVRFLLNK